MKSEIIQCADRPRVERHGQQMVIVFSDISDSRSTVETNISQAWCLAQDIMEIVDEYNSQRTNLHPVMVDALRAWAPR